MLQVSLFPLHLSYIFAAWAVPCDLYFLPPGWRRRLNCPDEPFCFSEFDFLEPAGADLDRVTQVPEPGEIS